MDIKVIQFQDNMHALLHSPEEFSCVYFITITGGDYKNEQMFNMVLPKEESEKMYKKMMNGLDVRMWSTERGVMPSIDEALDEVLNFDFDMFYRFIQNPFIVAQKDYDYGIITVLEWEWYPDEISKEDFIEQIQKIYLERMTIFRNKLAFLHKLFGKDETEQLKKITSILVKLEGV